MAEQDIAQALAEMRHHRESIEEALLIVHRLESSQIPAWVSRVVPKPANYVTVKQIVASLARTRTWLERAIIKLEKQMRQTPGGKPSAPAKKKTRAR